MGSLGLPSITNRRTALGVRIRAACFLPFFFFLLRLNVFFFRCSLSSSPLPLPLSSLSRQVRKGTDADPANPGATGTSELRRSKAASAALERSFSLLFPSRSLDFTVASKWEKKTTPRREEVEKKKGEVRNVWKYLRAQESRKGFRGVMVKNDRNDNDNDNDNYSNDNDNKGREALKVWWQRQQHNRTKLICLAPRWRETNQSRNVYFVYLSKTPVGRRG